MAQRKFLKPIVGGAIGLGILGIAGAVYASGEVTLITASGSGSGTSTTAVVFADSTLTCAADGDAGNVTEIGWYDNSAGTGSPLETAATGTGTTLSDALGAGLIAKGDTIYCIPAYASAVTLNDSVTVINSPPDAGTPEVTAIGGINDSITCADGAASPASDVDLDGLTFTYQWGVDSSIVVGVTTASTTPDALSAIKGQDVTCRITASDGPDATAGDSAAQTVLDTVPRVTTLSVTPANPATTDTVTCNYTYGDVDSDVETTSTYRWFSGASGTTLVASQTGATATVASLSGSAGDVIDCEVIPVNAAGTGIAALASTDSGTATVNTAGSFTAGPSLAIAGSGQTTDNLTCSWTFTDSVDSDPQVAAEVEWYVNSTIVAAATETITDATSTDVVTARSINAAVGDTVYCSVTASDVSLTVDQVTADTSGSPITIVDTVPVASSVAVSDSSPEVTDTLTCTYSYLDADRVTDGAVDADSGTVISWIVGSTTSSHTGVTAVMGSDLSAVKTDTVKCSVVPSNTSGSGSAAESSTATVQNATPDTPSAPSISVSGGANGTATCSGWSFSDDDTADLQGAATVSWFKNGSGAASGSSSVSGSATTSTINLSATTGGTLNSMKVNDTLTCAVSVKDNDTTPLESGISSASSLVYIANTAPTVSVGAVALTGAADGTATCSFTFSDVDSTDNQGAATVDWFYKNFGSAYGSADHTESLTSGTSSAISLSSDGTGDIGSVSGAGLLKCAVTVSDGTADSATVESAEVTIANTVPTIHQSASQSTVGPLVSPSSISTGDTVTCVAFIEEIDVESTSWSMAWTDSGGTALTGGGSSTTASGTVSAGTVSTSTAVISRSVSASIDDYYCTVIVTDTDGAVTESSSVSRSNTAPDQPTVTLSSSTPQVDDSVTCTWTYNDNDGDAQLGTVVAWLVDGTTQSSATYSGSTLTESQTMRSIIAYKGSSVVCEVTPNDGSSSGTAGSSIAATIANTAPVASAVAVTSTTPEVNDSISCDYTWADLDNTGGTADSDTGSSYAWFVGGTTVGSVTSQTTTPAALSADHVASGDVITCQVTPNDGDDAGSAVVGSSATVANSTPVSTANIPIGTYGFGDTVTCNVSGQDDNAHLVTGSLEFFIDSVSVGTTALGSFTGGSSAATSGSGTYTLVAADGGKDIDCTATYTDAIGASSSATGAASASNSVPVVTPSSLNSSSVVGDTLTCVTDVSDLDAQTVSIVRTWLSGSATGTLLQTDSTVSWSSSGGTTATTAVTGTYLVDPTDVLTDVFCVVNVDDGAGGTADTDSSVSVSNTTPTVTASVSGSATTNAILTCTGTANDPDSQTLTYTVDWTQGGSDLVTSPSKTGTVAAPAGGSFTDTYQVTSTDVAAGTPVDCDIVVDDGTITSSASASVGTTNSAPTLDATPTLSPTPPTVAAPVSCLAVGSDIDFDTITYGFEWTYDGTALTTLSSSGVSTAATLDLTVGAFTKSKTLRCTVTPSDTLGGSGSSGNVEVTIANAPPILSSVSEASSDTDLYASSNVVISFTSLNFDDADSGDPKNLDYVISQQVAGTGATASFTTGRISAGTFSVSVPLSGTSVSKGDVLFFDYTPNDGTDDGTGPSQTSLTVVNEPPSVPSSVTMTPVVNATFTSAAGSSARAAKDDIVCSGTGSTDADTSDVVAYTYSWYLDDGDGLFDSGTDTLVDSAYLIDSGEIGNKLNGVTIDGTGTVSGQVYWCSVVSTDTEDESTTSIETSHTVGVDCDIDEDGYESTLTCGGLDCDDFNFAIKPSVTETAADGTVGDAIDQDCDGVDECFVDNDGDGFRAGETLTKPGVDLACSGDLDFDDVDGVADDCDDNEALVNPGKTEIACDGLDNDCSTDGLPDEEEVDQDGDGYVACVVDPYVCEDYVSHDAMNEPSVWGLSWNGSALVVGGCDCNELAVGGFDVSPGLLEVCEALGTQVDSDCDGDANTSNGIPVTGSSVYYVDQDGDGFGYVDDFASFCNQPVGYSSNKEDCDDLNPDINPNAEESCNDTDDDCDGQVDNDDYQDLAPEGGCVDLFRDSDRDGYGDNDNSLCLCPTTESEDTGDSIVVELSSVQYTSERNDCYDNSSEIYPDFGDDFGLEDIDPAEFNADVDGFAERRIEFMDGHDNNCDGYVPLIELDCDSDGSFVKLPNGTFPDQVTRYDEVGLAPCWDTGLGIFPETPQYDEQGDALDLPTVNCAGQNLVLECDPYTRLWVVGRAGMDDFTGGFRENRPGNVADGDCDDICPDRFPGNTETCDGLDNDCSDYAPDSDDDTPYYSDEYDPELPERLWDEMDRDGVPDGMDAEIERIGTVTIEEFDLDQDGYIGCGDNIGSLREQVVPTSLSCTIEGFDLEYDDEQKEDCNNTCALTTPVAVEACNGFADTCVGDTEGSDGDADDAISCGIGSLNSGASLEEEVFVLTYFQDVEEDLSGGDPGPDNLNSEPQNGSGAVDTGWFIGGRRGSFDTVECDISLMSEPLAVKDVSTLVPMLLPRAVPPSDIEDWELGPDDIVATDQLLKQHLNALVGDESVDQAVRELDDRLAGRLEERDPLLDFCACVNGFESGERDCDVWRERGRCAVLKVTLSSTADEDIDLEVNDNDCIAGYPEQVVTRAVWNPVRIQESRQRVVEWECLQLYGKTCTEIAATGTPDAINVGGATEDCNNLLDDDGDGLTDCDDPECTTSECINTELGITPSTDWWLELGRHNVSVVTEGSLMGCWGDPTDGIDQIDATTGGDCDNADPLATRYNPEGPGDLYGRFWDLELDCSTCLDGVDNNCDGQTDCADPGCAACFVGQGFGVGGGSEASCAQLGCSSTGLSRSQTLGGLAMAFLALGLVGAGRRRRKTAI